MLYFLVFIFDRGDECFVWIGKEASVDERRNALTYGHVSTNEFILFPTLR